eukprot:scaffold79397_cov36-Phaeocystis_antarctica.AAC.1
MLARYPASVAAAGSPVNRRTRRLRRRPAGSPEASFGAGSWPRLRPASANPPLGPRWPAMFSPAGSRPAWTARRGAARGRPPWRAAARGRGPREAPAASGACARCAAPSRPCCSS